MIAKRVALKSARRSDFAELAGYLTDAQGNAARVGRVTVTNCEARTFEAAVAEVLATQRENTRATSDRTYHLIASFRAGERPDEATLRAIEARLCDGLGYGEHQRISVVHHDTGHLHVHIAINKIHPTRRTLHEPYRDHRTLARLCEELEHDHALQCDNHLPRKHGAANRAVEIERHAGVDSLLGWIRRECLEAMQAARSWTELHEVLRANGLELRMRGNGLVVAAGEEAVVKASSISRELSARKLTARFGPFEPSSEDESSLDRPTRQYRRQPGRSQADTAELYAGYEAERREVAALRSVETGRVRDRRTRLIEAARRRARLKRAAIGLVSGRLARKVLHAATRRTLAAEIEQIRKASARERRQINDRCRSTAWEPWLRARATGGDEEARQALQARAARGSRAGAATADGNAPHAPDRAERGSGVATVLRSSRSDAMAACLSIAFAGPRPEHATPNPSTSASLEENSRAPSTNAVRRGPDRGRPGGGRVPGPGPGRDRAGAVFFPVHGGGVRGKPDLGRVGREPPPQGLNRLRTLSELGVVRLDDGAEVLLPRHVPGHLEQQGTEHADGLRRPVPRPGVTAAAPVRDAAGRYIAEREEKRLQGIPIPRHSRYSRCENGPAAFLFAGLRRVDDEPLALLRKGEEIMVLPIDESTARRLGRTPLGESLTVTPSGAIKARSRSR